MRLKRNRESGYNIVEVLIAMAILGSVILSIVALFYLGRRNVYSGKQLTFANAVGVQIMEDLSNLDMTALYAAFGITTSTTLPTGTTTVNGIGYQNCIVRSTSNLGQDVVPPGFLTRWKNTIGTNNKLQTPVVTIILSPRRGDGTVTALWTGGTPNLPACAIMRVRVVISWKEGQRPRSITLDTIKTNRI